MPRVVIVGGGLSGCGAALAARKAGSQVTLLERTNMLVGVAMRSGESRGNGWFVGQHELKFLGGGELFAVLESAKLHEGMRFPDTDKAFLFNVGLIEPRVRKVLREAGVKVSLESRAVDVVKEEGWLRAVKLENGCLEEGDAFVDCTGTRGGIAFCNNYGKGCVMCLVKCLAFGDRVSIVEKAGGKEWRRIRADGTPGRLTLGLTVFKDTLAPELKARVEQEGLVKIPLPQDMVDLSKLGMMDSGRSKEFVENLILGDIGLVAKIFAFVSTSLEQLHKVPGLENVLVEHPGSPRHGHVGYLAIASRDTFLKVEGFENLFCGGEKAGNGSVDGAITTGYLAGHNAARQAAGRELLILPRSLAIGDWMAFTTERYRSQDRERKTSYNMSRGEYWERMQKIGLYTEDVDQIAKRVKETGLSDVLGQPLPIA